MKTLATIIRKEFIQFRRNSFLPRLCIMFPIMVMLVMPLVTTMDVKNVSVCLVDNDGATFSHHLAERIEATENTTLCGIEHNYAQALSQVELGEADVIVEIPKDYYRSLRTGMPKSLNISANSVNATKGSIGAQYVLQIIQREQLEHIPATALAMQQPGISITPLNLYNPTLNYRHFMIPGLMIMLLIMICGFLPALNMVTEKEKGTIEQINVTPIKPTIFTIGKLLPFWIIGMVVLTIAIIIAWLVYGLTPQSNILAVYLASFEFIIVISSLGVAIANRSNNMQQVMFVMFFFVIIFILMSGLMTPIQSMPQWAQTLTYAIPPRYYVDIMRAVYLRGASVADVWQWYAILAGIAALMIVAAKFSFRKQS